ncbi:tetratricopeptide repeat protein [Streptomyces olivoreticuli]
MADDHAPDHIEQYAIPSDRSLVNQVAGDQNNYLGPGSGPAPQALAALPAAPAQLVGREDHTASLLYLLDPQERGPSAVVVSAVAGLAGIGKTGLALHVAHEAVARGWFPGGVLYIALRGYDPAGPVSAEQAVAALLRALGIRDVDLPPTPEEQVGLYRSELARRADGGRPVLLVADDASSTAQVQPLVPARREHRLLITSRDTLTALPARLIDLDELAPGPATDLIADTLTRARPHDVRPQEEPRSLAEVAAYCGHLPLALQIAAAILKADPGLPIATLATDLADTRTRLQALSYADDAGQSLAVRAAFDQSYRRLDAESARMFPLLALNPGPDLATEAASVLIGYPARPVLAALVRAGLLIEQPVGGGRWRMHDLIRLYAVELAQQNDDGDQRERALDRLLEHYQATALAANSHLFRLPSDPTPERFCDRKDALTWLDAERANLVAAVTLAANTARLPLTVSLTVVLAEFLRWRRHFDDAITTGHQALAAIRELGDQHAEGMEGVVLDHLGIAFRGVRRFADAVDAHTQAAATFRELNDRHSEAVALDYLGIAFRGVRRFADAIDAHTQATATFQELNDRHSAAAALDNIGIALQETRRFADAVAPHTQAAATFRELNDRYGEAAALSNLGLVLWEAGQFADAIDTHTQAAGTFRELNDRHSEAAALDHLGLAYREAWRFADAINTHTQAAAIFRELNDRHSAAAALDNIGIALWKLRRFADAVDAHTQAAATFRELNDRHSEAAALDHLGLALLKVRRFADAVDAHTQAATTFRELNDRHSEGWALNNLGIALWRVRRFADAIAPHTQAATTFRELNDRYGEAVALSNLGITLSKVRRFTDGIDAHTQALAIFRELNNRQSENRLLNNLGIAPREERWFSWARHIWRVVIRRKAGPLM